MQRVGYVVIVPDPEILQKKRSLLELAKKGPWLLRSKSFLTRRLPPSPARVLARGRAIPSGPPARPSPSLTRYWHRKYFLDTKLISRSHNPPRLVITNTSSPRFLYLTWHFNFSIPFNTIEDPPPYHIQKYTWYYHLTTRQGEGCHHDEVLECDGITMLPCYHVTVTSWEMPLPTPGHQPMCYINPDMGPLLLSSQPPATLHHLLWEAGQWTRNRAQGGD